MKIAKVFQSGNSQAIRLPKVFQFKSSEVEIFKQNDTLIIREKRQNLKHAFELLVSITNDFFEEGRVDTPPQKLEKF